jgi:hypothetical protein
MTDDFSQFERLKQDGADAERACELALSQGGDFFYQVRMLRAVFGLDLGVARDIAAKLELQKRTGGS